MLEVQIPRKYKYDVMALMQMIDDTLGVVYPKTINGNGVLTIDADITPQQKLALKNNFLAMASEYQDFTA